jgi:hypothetical protein
MAVETILSTQIGSMVEMLERSRDARRTEVRESAEKERAAILAKARQEARARVAEAVRSRRRSNEGRIRAARAEIESEARSRRLVRAQCVLDEGWSLVKDALSRRWADADARRRWVEAVLTQAARVLPGDGWRIRHPNGLTKADRSAVKVPPGVTAPEWAPADFDEGVCIERASVVVDGTPEGLLVHRQATGARLLALYFAERERESETESDGRPGGET